MCSATMLLNNISFTKGIDIVIRYLHFVVVVYITSLLINSSLSFPVRGVNRVNAAFKERAELGKRLQNVLK